MNISFKNRMLKTGTLLLTALMVISVSACQKNPDSIIKNKDMDKLIEQAGNKKETDIGIDELLAKYDTYKNTVKDDSLKVTLNIDAKVSIPQTDKMSVIRVKQEKISQELLDKVRKELVGETPLYDGTVLLTETKKTIESSIKNLRDIIDTLENSTDDIDPKMINQLSAKELEEYKKYKKDERTRSLQECQTQINELEEKYKAVPADINIKDKKSDYKIISVADEYKKNKEDKYYSWMYSMDEKIESYYGISDGENKNYASLSVLNSPDYGNRIMFRKGSHGYEFTSSVCGANDSGRRWQSEEIPEDIKVKGPQNVYGETKYVKCPEDTVNLTRDDALKQADDFLQKVGIAGFKAYEGELYSEFADIRYNCDLDGITYRTYYIIKYMRNINGAFVTAGGEDKHNEGWNGNTYVKQNWSEESIEFRINDNGIVGFDFNVPVKEVETVVDDSALKSFEEIKQTFEKMAVITNAQQDLNSVITIDKVVLGYARISEKDSFDTGLLVPVWDFFGKIENEDSGKFGSDYKIIMTINAIDGSVIDRELGY